MRRKPISLAARFYIGNYKTDGELQIHPRGGTTQLVGGHFYIGDDAIPFTGQINGMRIQTEQPALGRPPETEEDMGLFMFQQSVLLLDRTKPKSDRSRRKATIFANAKIRELWHPLFYADDDGSKRRRKIRNAKNWLKGQPRFFLPYSGVEEDFSDYAVTMFLEGATIRVKAGKLTARGPAWLWRWGWPKAERHGSISVAADVPDARDMTYTVTRA